MTGPVNEKALKRQEIRARFGEREGFLRWKLGRIDSTDEESTRVLDVECANTGGLSAERQAYLCAYIKPILRGLYEEQRRANAIAHVELPFSSNFRPWFWRFCARVGLGGWLARRERGQYTGKALAAQKRIGVAEGEGRR